MAILGVAGIALAANPLGVQPTSTSTSGVTSGGITMNPKAATGTASCGSGGGGIGAQVTVDVWRTNNNTYNFVYYVTNTGSVSIDKVKTLWYQKAGSLPDVNYRTDLGGTGNPSTATRAGADDGDIEWDFSSNQIPSGNTNAKVFFVETICVDYQSNTLTEQGSVTVYSGSSSCTASPLPNPYHAADPTQSCQ